MTNLDYIQHKNIMVGDLKTMSDGEVARAVEVLLNRYIPNCVATGQHPSVVTEYRLRAVAAMEECVVRQRAACRKIAHLVGGGE
jgi:hypothetical protein